MIVVAIESIRWRWVVAQQRVSTAPQVQEALRVPGLVVVVVVVAPMVGSTGLRVAVATRAPAAVVTLSHHHHHPVGAGQRWRRRRRVVEH